jgi:hypothetical protein
LELQSEILKCGEMPVHTVIADGLVYANPDKSVHRVQTSSIPILSHSPIPLPCIDTHSCTSSLYPHNVKPRK